MSDICFINPPHPYLKQPNAQAPLGMLYVAAAARQAGYTVGYCNLSGRTVDEQLDLMPARWYGLTGTVVDLSGILTVCRHIRTTAPDARIVVGGPISLMPEWLCIGDLVDVVVAGEGEVDLVRLLAGVPPPKDGIVRAARLTSREVEALPWPARDLLDTQGGNVFAFNRSYIGDRAAVIMSSRGCPHCCAFCASSGLWTRRVTYRSVESVLEEAKHIRDTYGIWQLRFNDDNLTTRRTRLRDLCEGLKRLGMIWRCSIRTLPNDRRLFEMMYNGGCREVSYGIESGDQDVLDGLDKGTTVEDNFLACKHATQAGMVVRLLMMIGTPPMTMQTVDRNIAFLERARPYYDTVALKNFVPLPGCAITADPARWNVTILPMTSEQLNFHFYDRHGWVDWPNLISFGSMTDEQQMAEKQRLREWVDATGKANEGG